MMLMMSMIMKPQFNPKKHKMMTMTMMRVLHTFHSTNGSSILKKLVTKKRRLGSCSKIVNPNICLGSYRNLTAKTKNNRHKNLQSLVIDIASLFSFPLSLSPSLLLLLRSFTRNRAQK